MLSQIETEIVGACVCVVECKVDIATLNLGLSGQS